MDIQIERLERKKEWAARTRTWWSEERNEKSKEYEERERERGRERISARE